MDVIPKKKRCLLKALLMIPVIAAVSILTINYYVKLSVLKNIIEPKEAVSLKADCILVLGAGIWKDKPSHMLEDRLLCAIDLYKGGCSDKMLMSGDHSTKWYDEVNTMKNFAVKEGVPSNRIFMDHAGLSTYDSMYRAKNIFKVKKVVIVTQRYHLYRALYIARSLGLEAYGVASDPRKYAGQEKRELREIGARIKDFFLSVRKPESTPGKVIPITGNGDETNDN